MKIILKYGTIGAVLLLATIYTTLLPFFKIYFDESMVGAFNFVIMGGINLFGINSYLKSDKVSNYNYGFGLLICLGIGLIASSIYSIVFISVNFSQHELLVNLPRILARIIRFLPLIILHSLVIPMFFRNTRKAKSIGDEDILDNNLNV